MYHAVKGKKGNVMTDKEYRKVLARNIKRIAYENHKTQADIVRDLNLKQTTVSTWMSGTRMPRMEHIDLLCHYFNCTRADIMNDSTETTPEKALLSLFGKLNDKGKEVAIERIAELCQLSRYTEVDA